MPSAVKIADPPWNLRSSLPAGQAITTWGSLTATGCDQLRREAPEHSWPGRAVDLVGEVGRAVERGPDDASADGSELAGDVLLGVPVTCDDVAVACTAGEDSQAVVLVALWSADEALREDVVVPAGEVGLGGFCFGVRGRIGDFELEVGGPANRDQLVAVVKLPVVVVGLNPQLRFQRRRRLQRDLGAVADQAFRESRRRSHRCRSWAGRGSGW